MSGGEYDFNRGQAIFIIAKTETPTATDITIEIVRKFEEYERASGRPAIGGNAPAQDHWASSSKASR